MRETTSRRREAQAAPSIVRSISNANLEDYKRFFDLSLDMLCIAGLDGYFKMVNPAWEATLGFTVEEMVNRPFIDFIHPDDVKATNETYATQIEQGQDVVEFENRYLCKDGSYKWLVWNAKTVTEEELIYAVVSDITERKRAEELLQRLAAIVDSSDDAIVGKTLDGEITSWNRAAEQLYGYSVEEAVGRPINLIIPPDRSEEMQAILGNIARGEGLHNFESRRLRKDGQVLDVSLTVSPVRDSRGRITGASTIGRDISEHKRTEEALKESEERSRAILDTAIDCIITINERGVVESLNPAGERMFGYAAEEVLGRNVSMLMPAPYREEHDGYLANYVRTGEKKIIGVGREVSGRRKDGTTFPMDLAVSEAQRGKRRRFVGIVRDITERKRTEEALAQKTLELERSNAELEDFTHVVSHDLKEPLRGIEAFSGFLAEDYAGNLDERGRSYLKVLQDSAVRLRDLIDDLLQLSRIGRIKPQYRYVSMGSLLEEIVQGMQFSLKDKDVDLHVATDLPALVCDPVRIRQVFENLISNAIKYNDKPAPSIQISCAADGDEYVFSVKDNGPGIDPKYHAKIFRIFQRLVLREDHEGTGVGLTICKKIIEGHGGRIWVESDGQGHGSIFSFSIPKSIEPGEAKED